MSSSIMITCSTRQSLDCRNLHEYRKPISQQGLWYLRTIPEPNKMWWHRGFVCSANRDLSCLSHDQNTKAYLLRSTTLCQEKIRMKTPFRIDSYPRKMFFRLSWSNMLFGFFFICENSGPQPPFGV